MWSSHGHARLPLSLVLRSHSLKALKRNILGFIGVGPIRDTVIGGVDGLGPEGVAKLETRFRGLGATAG